MALEEEEEQPVSPLSRLMHAPCYNISILTVLGFETRIDIIEFNKCLEQTLLKHPRFSSILVVKDEIRFECSWKPTIVNLNDHICVPSLNPQMESPYKFVEDYTARVANNPFDLSKPLWEAHVLNIKTVDANSTVIFKIHHSMGDGVSIISLFIACAKKKSDIKGDGGSLPSFPSMKKQGPPKGLFIMRMFSLVWKAILIIYYTLLDFILALATIMFLNVENPLKKPSGMEHSATRYVHHIMKLDDVKIIKNAMKATINDVLLGAIEEGLCKYLEKRHDTERADGIKLPTIEDIINKHPIVLGVAFNLRSEPSIKELAEVIEKREKLEKVKWGNKVAVVDVPLMMFDDPIKYVRSVKCIMDKRKISFLPKLQYFIGNQIIKVFGIKVPAEIVRRHASNMIAVVSNLFGPEEEIILFGHPMNYIALTTSGQPEALGIHFVSYAKKIVICLAADEKAIADPRELCDYIQNSIENMKDLVIKRGLSKDSKG